MSRIIEAGIKTFPVEKGMFLTWVLILVSVSLFTLTAFVLFLIGYTGLLYLISVCVAGLIWLLLGLKGLSASSRIIWGKNMFLFSLFVDLVLFSAITIEHIIRIGS